MKKKVFALCMVAALVVSMVGCDKKPANEGEKVGTETETKDEVEDVTLKVWAPENQIQNGIMDSMTKSFQDLHPEWNITFTVETQGEDTAKDEILKDVGAAGRPLKKWSRLF